MAPLPLTRRQRQILDFYIAYSTQHGISPTLEEVARHFQVNKVTIFGHVAELERKKVLTRVARRVSRGLQPNPDSPQAAPTGRAILQVLGSIAAGSPLEALEDPETIDLTVLVPADRDVFALRVRGDSMIEDGIRDGDLALVERRTNARDGEIVVAVLPDETATMKRIYRDKRGWRLQPANGSMAPILTESVEVRGVVIGVVRRF